MPAFTVPANHYFVLGDNRKDSLDSHNGWTVAEENIVGEVWLRFWPLSDWGVVRGFPPEGSIAGEYQANLANGENTCR